MDILNKICRTCNTEQDNLVHIFKENQSASIVKMLEYCTHTSIKDELKYPPWICFSCLKQLEISYRFLKRFQLAQNEFEVAYCHFNAMAETRKHTDGERDVERTTLNICRENKVKVLVEKVKSQDPVIAMSVEYIKPEPSSVKEVNLTKVTEKSPDVGNIPDHRSKDSPSVTCSICQRIFFTAKALNLHLKLNHKQKTAIS